MLTFEQLPAATNEILERLKAIEVALQQKNIAQEQIEIIDRKELQKRLNVSEPTIIRWEKKKKIPVLHVGTSVRYNWCAVVKALENKNTKT